MSQSKLWSSEKEKMFVIRHCFKNVMNMKVGESVDGPIEKHFNIPWKIRISRLNEWLGVYLDCMVPDECEAWAIETHTKRNIFRKSYDIFCSFDFNKKETFAFFGDHIWNELPALLIDGRLTYEFTVVIKKATGVHLEVVRSRNFDNDLARENSDVTLIVGDQKFHVLKKYLSLHSPYFQALFFGNLSESGKSEIELKDIDPNDFQLFLDLVYGESLVGDSSVLEILHLADFFNSKTAIGRCEDFLLEKSNLSLKDKFDAATKYKLEELKKKCVSQLKTHDDILSIVPENASQIKPDLWKELLVKAITMGK